MADQIKFGNRGGTLQYSESVSFTRVLRFVCNKFHPIEPEKTLCFLAAFGSWSFQNAVTFVDYIRIISTKGIASCAIEYL